MSNMRHTEDTVLDFLKELAELSKKHGIEIGDHFDLLVTTEADDGAKHRYVLAEDVTYWDRFGDYNADYILVDEYGNYE